LGDRHRIGAAALPEWNTQADGKGAGAFGKDRRDIERGKLGRRRIIDLQAAGHDRAKLVKTDTFVLQLVAREPGLDHAKWIGPGQAALGGEFVLNALLHPLQMVRLKKEPFLPVNFYGHEIVDQPAARPRMICSAALAIASWISCSMAGSEACSWAKWTNLRQHAPSTVSFH